MLLLFFTDGHGSIAKRMTKKITHCSQQINKAITEYNTFTKVPAGTHPTSVIRSDVLSEESNLFDCLQQSNDSTQSNDSRDHSPKLKRLAIKEAHLYNRATEEIVFVENDTLKGYEYLKSQHSLLCSSIEALKAKDVLCPLDKGKVSMIKSEIISLEKFIRNYVLKVKVIVDLPDIQYVFYKTGNETLFDLLSERDISEVAALLRSVQIESINTHLGEGQETVILSNDEIQEIMAEVQMRSEESSDDEDDEDTDS